MVEFNRRNRRARLYGNVPRSAHSGLLGIAFPIDESGRSSAHVSIRNNVADATFTTDNRALPIYNSEFKWDAHGTAGGMDYRLGLWPQGKWAGWPTSNPWNGEMKGSNFVIPPY
jgi:hypothetical protein